LLLLLRLLLNPLPLQLPLLHNLLILSTPLHAWVLALQVHHACHPRAHQPPHDLQQPLCMQLCATAAAAKVRSQLLCMPSRLGQNWQVRQGGLGRSRHPQSSRNSNLIILSSLPRLKGCCPGWFCRQF
jgi:hypothetical protein